MARREVTARFALAILCLVLAMVALLFGIVSAKGQTANCIHNALPQFEAKLERDHHETLKHVATTQGGGMLRVYVSPDATWSILLILPSNMVCMIAAGEGWQAATGGRAS